MIVLALAEMNDTEAIINHISLEPLHLDTINQLSVGTTVTVTLPLKS